MSNPPAHELDLLRRWSRVGQVLAPRELLDAIEGLPAGLRARIERLRKNPLPLAQLIDLGLVPEALGLKAVAPGQRSAAVHALEAEVANEVRQWLASPGFGDGVVAAIETQLPPGRPLVGPGGLFAPDLATLLDHVPREGGLASVAPWMVEQLERMLDLDGALRARIRVKSGAIVPNLWGLAALPGVLPAGARQDQDGIRDAFFGAVERGVVPLARAAIDLKGLVESALKGPMESLAVGLTELDKLGGDLQLVPDLERRIAELEARPAAAAPAPRASPAPGGRGRGLIFALGLLLLALVQGWSAWRIGRLEAENLAIRESRAELVEALGAAREALEAQGRWAPQDKEEGR